MRSCAAPHCNRKYAKGKLYSWHKFPSDPVVKSQWLAAIGLDDVPKVSLSYICSEHFSEDCFYSMRLNGLRMLKRGSVPSIFASSRHMRSASEVTEVPCASHGCSPDVERLSNAESLRGKRLFVEGRKGYKLVKLATSQTNHSEDECYVDTPLAEESIFLKDDLNHTTTDDAEQQTFEEVVYQSDVELETSTNDADFHSPEVYNQTPSPTGNGQLEQPENFGMCESPSNVGSIQRYTLNIDYGYTRNIFDKNPRKSLRREISASPVLEVVNVSTQIPHIFSADTSTTLSCKHNSDETSWDADENHYAMQEEPSTRDVGTSPPPSFSEVLPIDVMPANEGCQSEYCDMIDECKMERDENEESLGDPRVKALKESSNVDRSIVFETKFMNSSSPPTIRAVAWSCTQNNQQSCNTDSERCELKNDTWENSDEFSEEEAVTCPYTLKSKKESINISPSRQRGTRLWNPRYIGDCTIDHLDTPEKAQRFLTKAKKESDTQRRKIKTLQQKNRRLTFRVENLEAIVLQLKKHITTIQAKKDMNNNSSYEKSSSS